jgi:hypothetical protein
MLIISLSSRQRDCGYGDALLIWKSLSSDNLKGLFGHTSALQLFTGFTEHGTLLLQSPTDKDFNIRKVRERFNLGIFDKEHLSLIVIGPCHGAILAQSLFDLQRASGSVTKADNVKRIIS